MIIGIFKNSKIYLALLTCFVVLSLNPCSVWSKPIELKLAHVTAINSGVHDWCLSVQRYLDMHAPGVFDVKIYPMSKLGSARQLIEQTVGGSIHIVMSNMGEVSLWVPGFLALDLPYLFPDDVTVWDIFDHRHPVIQEMSAELNAKTGLTIVGASSSGGFRCFANSKREVRTPEDLRGLKLRTIPSKLFIEFLTNMGVIPTPITWAELYTSLQTGVVDGTCNSVADMVDMKFDEIIKYITLDNHTPLRMFYLMNHEFFLSLSEKERALLTAACDYATDVSPGQAVKYEITNTKKFIDGGGKIYTPTPKEKELFIKKALPTYKWLKEEYPDAAPWIDKLQKAVDSSRQSRGFKK